MEANTVVPALAALAHGSRLSVFRLLVTAGPSGIAASKIAESLGLAPSSLSFHLKELTQAGLIAAKPTGRSIIYSANFDAMNALVGYLTENCCGGNPCTSAGTCVPSGKSKE